MRTLILILLAAGLMTAQETLDKTFDGVKKLDFKIQSGDTEIVKTSGTQVRVKISYDDKEVKVRAEMRGNRLMVDVKRKSDSRQGWNSHSDTRLLIETPDGMDVEFEAGSGDVDVEGVSFADMQMSTGSGNIDLASTKSTDMSISTGSGNIKVNAHTGDFKVATGSGDIRMDKVTGDVNMATGSGDITGIDITGALKIGTGSGDVDLTDLNAKGRVKIGTGSGDVTVSLAAPLNHDVTLGAGSGDVTLDFNGQKINGYFTFKAKRESQIRAPFEFDKTDVNREWGGRSVTKTAKVGNGQPDIDMGTGSGEVEIKK